MDERVRGRETERKWWRAREWERESEKCRVDGNNHEAVQYQHCKAADRDDDKQDDFPVLPVIVLSM